VPAIPGLTGDSASARWLAKADAISNAATALNTRNERRARTEVSITGVVLWIQKPQSSASALRCVVSDFVFSLGGILDLKLEGVT
jgi:hypothetical protein